MYPRQTVTPLSATNAVMDEVAVEKGLQCLRLLCAMDVSGLKALVDGWLERSVNLPLAGPFVVHCAGAVAHIAQQSSNNSNSNNSQYGSDARICQTAEALTSNTLTAVALDHSPIASDPLSRTLGEHLRREALGYFITTASRAALGTRFFPRLYANEVQRRKLIRLLTHVGDCCLEICLELNCLNDLQLILQYECFIVHSQVHGDQSECTSTTWFNDVCAPPG